MKRPRHLVSANRMLLPTATPIVGNAVDDSITTDMAYCAGTSVSQEGARARAAMALSLMGTAPLVSPPAAS